MTRSSLITLLAILASLSGSAQEALPPVPGFAPIPETRQPGQTAGEVPPPAATTAASPSSPAPGTEPTAAAETTGTPDAEGTDAAPAAEPLAATDPGTDDAASTPGSPAPATPGSGETPPGAGGNTSKVDFLQRSNLILARLLENERPMDPFGLVMDPANAKAAPVLADQYEEVEQTPQLNSSSLKNALLTLPITGIYPKRGMIVLGARSFEVGGQFGMKLQDLTIRLRFEGIRGGEIFFKDMETREVTSIPFNPRPAEFEPIAKGAKLQPGQGISGMNDLFIAN
jgi:hypothetical protein